MKNVKVILICFVIGLVCFFVFAESPYVYEYYKGKRVKALIVKTYPTKKAKKKVQPFRVVELDETYESDTEHNINRSYDSDTGYNINKTYESDTE